MKAGDKLYNPQSSRWSLDFANSDSGVMSQPTIGSLKDGRGEFFNQETFNGRAIFVRFVISAITPNSCRSALYRPAAVVE